MDSPQYQELGLVSQEQQPIDQETVRATWKFLAGLSSNLTLVGPCLFSNLLGLLNVVLNIICRKLLPIGRLETVGMVLASIFAVLYALCALWAYGRDIADEIRVDDADRTMIPLTEEEMQRQQLLRLLQENQGKKKSSAKDVFTNTRPLWHPPGARGIYGGAAIAQSLAAAMRTVPSEFAVHSMHCYFVLAGDSEIPILYHVERVRDGRSFITRTVQARQRGRPIFTTTLSFSRANSGGKKKLEHATSMPDVTLPDDSSADVKRRLYNAGGGPFESHKLGTVNRDSSKPEDKRIRRCMRARGNISEAGGHHAHLSALAYVTDSYFIGTVSRVHDIPRFASPAELKAVLNALKNPSDLDDDEISRAFKELKEEEAAELRRQLEGALSKAEDPKNKHKHKEVGMMVSLDHSIYFHNPWAFRADEWMVTEMESPWAGEGRGLVLQNIWSKDGTLIATCTQEGVVRLKQDEPPRSKI
ncbi:thioesterase-like superfamily-domain-containing protein [Aspergillus sergii]|uniref:Thioesterase-like superfamily-domain-containing protein n=1 Tax=Aspergillus sergii TaxID=1034303 RepID=A0A5N6WVM6_9EURO|nr:thioesterase-like superfamily-domain-containing protein [Aspergillus sergii]